MRSIAGMTELSRLKDSTTGVQGGAKRATSASFAQGADAMEIPIRATTGK
jgi:hypothetical protein